MVVDLQFMSVLASVIVGPVVVGICLSFAMEWMLTPRATVFYRRSISAISLHVGSWLLLFCLEMMLFKRPWFAMGNVLAIQLLLVLVNNAKYHAMREPFLVHDFEYFTDAIKHPRLYLPFFGVFKTILALCVFLGVLAAGIALEPSVLGVASGTFWLGAWLSGLLVSVMLLWIGLRLNRLPVTLNPSVDFLAMGQVTFLWLYAVAHFKHQVSTPECAWAEVVSNIAAVDSLPDIVAVQSESFFDARQDYNVIDKEVLSGFDRICSESVNTGRLSVPAWGANTIRTESAFLTGRSADDLGIHQFSPYRHFIKHRQVTIAHQLKSLGYKTVCVHPYPASFYMREKLYPELGFDHFVDISDFNESQKVGQYIGDMAVANYVKSLLRGDEQPVFVFVITMENHGPLHLEKANEADKEAFYKEHQPENCEDLTVYLRHIRQADRMIDALRDHLAVSPRGGMLCWYGDHVPIMPKVYKQLGLPSGLTDYFIWHSATSDTTCQSPTMQKDISELAPMLLTQLVVCSANGKSDKS